MIDQTVLKNTRCLLAKHPWTSFQLQGGVFKDPIPNDRPAYRMGHCIIIAEDPIWITVEESCIDEDELSLDVGIDKNFGNPDHEKKIRPARSTVTEFPGNCKIDCFLNCQIKILFGHEEEILKSILFVNNNNEKLLMHVDEYISFSILVSTNKTYIEETIESNWPSLLKGM